jgi:hypothetical protein
MDKLHEESRKQFEEAAAKKLNFSISTVIASRKGDSYDSGILSVWWDFWQASRASIVVELPNGLTTREALDLGYMGDYAAGVDDGIEETAKSLRSIGLSIKGEGV